MEHDAPAPRYSGLRPPTGPPTITAIGFSPESDGDEFFTYLKRLAAKHERARSREIEGRLLANLLQLHTEHSPNPEYIYIRRDYFLKLRQEVEDQIVLEQMIQRPQRTDRLPGSEEAGMIEAHKKTLAAIDDMLGTLSEMIREAEHPFQEEDGEP